MSALRDKYAATLDNRDVPEIVFLDRSDRLAAEREILEHLLGAAPQFKQKDWLGRLVNEANEQFWGAWFEIMLWEWLQTVGSAVPEPEIEGNWPDYALTVGGQEIAVEARACLLSPNEREAERRLLAGESRGLTWFRVDGSGLKPPLREKAAQHQALRKAHHPYVLAIMLESTVLTAEEVVTAWFGDEVAIIVGEQVEAVTTDRKGLHYWGSDIHHTSVSGTLVFKPSWRRDLKRRVLEAWYIENPFASVTVDPSLFPVQSRYVAVEKSPRGIHMGWRRK